MPSYNNINNKNKINNNNNTGGSKRPKSPKSIGGSSKKGGDDPRTIAAYYSGPTNFMKLKEQILVALPSKGPAEREAYIEYALDMVLHNLISSGQLDASKSYLLKTAEMKAHIGRMCDKIRKEQQDEGGKGRGPSHISTTSPTIKHPPLNNTDAKRWALQPNSLPITIFTDKDPRRGSSNKAKNTRSKSLSDYGKVSRVTLAKNYQALVSSRTKSPNKNKTPQPQKSANFLTPPRVGPVGGGGGSVVTYGGVPTSQIGWYEYLYPGSEQNGGGVVGGVPLVPDGSLPMTYVPNMMRALKKGDSIKDEPLKAGAQAFGAKLDMRGFNNEEISLDMDGRRLTITGLRRKRDGLNARKATESIEIPEGINVDNLKIARRLDGILVIDETVLDTEIIYS